MNNNELRIGNFITDIWASEGSYWPVVTISSKYPIIKYGKAFSANIKNVKGIPLTEEWLLKFGFVWSVFHQAYDNHLFRYQLTSDLKDGFRVIISKTSFDMGVSLKYVHQLQNWYFSLTGEELITKTLKTPIQ